MTMPGRRDSLKKRYAFKLLNNVVANVFGLASFSLIPRSLGPAAYGNFSFLSAFFNQTVGFLDGGTSTAFFTKLSQNPQDKGLVRFYGGYIALVTLLIAGIVGLAYETRLSHWLWPGQRSRYVAMGAAYGLLAWISMVMNNMMDAQGLTVPGETAKIAQEFFSLVLLLSLYAMALLNLTTYFAYIYVTTLFLLGLWARALQKAHIEWFPALRLRWKNIRRYGAEFYAYSMPLLTYSIVCLLIGLLDRWILQRFAGSVQQGYFGLSVQIGSACFLFATSMTPLLMKEFSGAFASQDHESMRSLFMKYIPLIYSVTAFFSVFCAVNADKLCSLFAGAQYEGAVLPVAIMSLYPIHQTYGQLSSTLLFATGQTRLYRNLGTIVMLLGLPLTYLLLAPRSVGGLNGGALGLAIKTVALQFLGVNLQLWYNAKYLGVSFFRLLRHQLGAVAILALFSVMARAVAALLFRQAWTLFLFSGLSYVLLCGTCLAAFPGVFGCTREVLKSQWNQSVQMLIELTASS